MSQTGGHWLLWGEQAGDTHCPSSRGLCWPTASSAQAGGNSGLESRGAAREPWGTCRISGRRMGRALSWVHPAHCSPAHRTPQPCPAPSPCARTWTTSPTRACAALLGWDESRTKRSRCWKRGGPDTRAGGIWVRVASPEVGISPGLALSRNACPSPQPRGETSRAGHRGLPLGHSEVCTPLRARSIVGPMLLTPGLSTPHHPLTRGLVCHPLPSNPPTQPRS